LLFLLDLSDWHSGIAVNHIVRSGWQSELEHILSKFDSLQQVSVVVVLVEHNGKWASVSIREVLKCSLLYDWHLQNLLAVWSGCRLNLQ